MNKKDNFLIGLKELASNKMRTSLTMLGIIFGVGAVIAMLSIGEGARQETLEQIELLGTNNIIIKEIPSEEIDDSETSFSPGLTTKDMNSIKELNPFVETAIAQREAKSKVMYKSQIIDANIVGTNPDYVAIYNSQVLSGEFFRDSHIQSYANVCVIGHGIKEKLFRFEDPIGKFIKSEGIWFRIIGVVASKNISSSGMENLGVRNFNNDVYLPLTTMIYKIKKYVPGEKSMDIQMRRGINIVQNRTALDFDRSSVSQITVKVKNDAPIEHALSVISRIMERKHYSVKDYEIIVPEQLLEQKQKTQMIFNIVMGAIAGISLLVGGIGIMNIMLANILERTREIGIRRAVGATRNDVLGQFLYEALTISVIGGILGIITGFILTSIITGYAEWRTIITPMSVIVAFFVSVGVGLVFGIYPAKKAADKDPIESLRYE